MEISSFLIYIYIYIYIYHFYLTFIMPRYVAQRFQGNDLDILDPARFYC